MHYLIDGHNVIGHMSDIDLADPHDEAHLVLKLRAWAAADRKRLLTVIFDGGLPGGRSRDLSAGPVRVIFATAGRTADGRLIRLIEAVANPAEFTLVTSDRRIIDAARARKMPHWPSDRLARELASPRRVEAPPAEDDPSLSEAEVAEWLELFGPVPERPPPRPRPRAKPSAAEADKPAPKRPLTTAKHEDRALDEDEVAAWLAIFGGEKKVAERPSPTTKKPAPRRTRPRQPADSATETDDLSAADRAAWRAFLGDDPDA